MSLPDGSASAAIDAEVIRPVWFIYLDFLGDPARANSSGTNIQISGSGDAELDGLYIGIDARFIEVGDVKSSSGGGDTVIAKLSGLRGLDDEDRETLGDPARWQGRVARMWRIIRDEFGNQQGAVQHYYTGYMQSLGHMGNADEVALELSIEGYLAAFSAPSNRTYMSQKDYDPDDLSAQAAIETANGNMQTDYSTVNLGPLGHLWKQDVGGSWIKS
jgi:hypothetical protein